MKEKREQNLSQRRKGRVIMEKILVKKENKHK